MIKYDTVRIIWGRKAGEETGMNTMVIGIAGGTGSGKTTVTEKLQ